MKRSMEPTALPPDSIRPALNSSRLVHRKMAPVLALVMAVWLSACIGQQESAQAGEWNPAQELLQRSLAYHDPDGVWGKEAVHLHWASSRPNGDLGYAFDIELAPNGDFAMVGERKGRLLEYEVAGDRVRSTVDGESSFSDEVRDEMGLTRDDGKFWRDYLGYLGAFPMCLEGSGVNISPQVMKVKLAEEDVLAFDVTFSPGVGDDTYTFYFEPTQARLVGCRFYHEDPNTDGETILFEGESRVGSLRLPRTRRWYTNVDNRFLGTDVISEAASQASRRFISGS
ncbi:MAG: hypothetical protein ACI9F9_000937 [Candidatus Paceibacteria bacterium]|jgi:hypothetical protein